MIEGEWAKPDILYFNSHYQSTPVPNLNFLTEFSLEFFMPTVDLNFRTSRNNRVFVEATNIKADSGLEYPRLIVPVRFDLNPLKDGNNEEKNYVIFDVYGSLYSTPSSQKISDSIANYMPYKVFGPNTYTIPNLEFPLSANQLTRIESDRRGDLPILLKLQLMIGIYEGKVIAEFDNAFAQMELDIPQSHWVEKILPALSFGEFFIIEIPKDNKEIQEAWRYIEVARKCYDSWDTKGTYANCREVGTCLDKILQDQIGNTPMMKKWKRSIEKFKPLASLDLHLEEIQNQQPEGRITVGKHDAEHLLIASQALVKYAQELLAENSK